jgi:hypothetical protein
MDPALVVSSGFRDVPLSYAVTSLDFISLSSLSILQESHFINSDLLVPLSRSTMPVSIYIFLSILVTAICKQKILGMLHAAQCHNLEVPAANLPNSLNLILKPIQLSVMENPECTEACT